MWASFGSACLPNPGRGLQTQHQPQRNHQPTDDNVLHEKSPFPVMENKQNAIIVGSKRHRKHRGPAPFMLTILTAFILCSGISPTSA